MAEQKSRKNLLKKPKAKWTAVKVGKTTVKVGDIVEMSFVDIGGLEMRRGFPRFLEMKKVRHVSRIYLSLEGNFKFFVNGGRVEVVAVSSRIIQVMDPFANGPYWVHIPIIKSCEIVDRVRKIQVPSLSYELKFSGDTLHAECQTVSREDCEKIFRVMADWLGYELTG